MQPEKELDLTDFELIHTLVIMYAAFADQSGIPDHVLDVVLERINDQDFGLRAQQKSTEIIRALNWFTHRYTPSEFPRFKEKLDALRLLPAERRQTIIEDLRKISSAFSRITERKKRLFESVVLNLGFDPADYSIE